MVTRTLDQLNQEFDALVVRVNNIDGANLSAAVKGQLDQLKAQIAGLKQTLGNVNMGYKQDLAAIKKDVADLRAMISPS